MTGSDRAMVYAVAAATGFRANELRNLTPASFDLDSDPASVPVVRPRRPDAEKARATGTYGGPDRSAARIGNLMQQWATSAGGK